MTKIGIDIDNTITAYPQLFVFLTQAVKLKGGQVHVISSRSSERFVRVETEKELRSLGIIFDELYLLPEKQVAEERCPHKELDWYQKYIWQKLDYCQRNGIDAYFDDEDKVIEVFKKYGESVCVLKVC